MRTIDLTMLDDGACTLIIREYGCVLEGTLMHGEMSEASRAAVSAVECMLLTMAGLGELNKFGDDEINKVVADCLETLVNKGVIDDG